MSTAVKISNISASISFASNAADLSLSITAAIPFNPFFVLITGIPPPPTAITIFPLRSNSEIDELEMMQELDFISEQELKEEIQMVKFNYYLSSEDGRNILKKGHVKNVKDNVLRKTIK